MAGVREARALAERLHEGQTDKSGAPYIGHLRRVVEHLVDLGDASESELVAAWLHDTIEDTPMTADELLDLGFSREAVEIIQLVTRDRSTNETYAQWIGRLVRSGNRSAIRVKLADNRDNGDRERLAALGRKKAQSLGRRYAIARAELEAVLAG